jgi:hypothetical protein
VASLFFVLGLIVTNAVVVHFHWITYLAGRVAGVHFLGEGVWWDAVWRSVLCAIWAVGFVIAFGPATRIWRAAFGESKEKPWPPVAGLTIVALVLAVFSVIGLVVIPTALVWSFDWPFVHPYGW